MQDDKVKQTARPRKKQSERKKALNRTECTLSCLVQAVAGKKLVVELRNDLVVRGTLDEADEFMNLYMSEVSCQTAAGHKSQYKSMYIRGRTIRYIHFPRNLDPAAAVEQQRQRIIDMRMAEYKARVATARLDKSAGGTEHEQGPVGHGGTDGYLHEDTEEEDAEEEGGDEGGDTAAVGTAHPTQLPSLLDQDDASAAAWGSRATTTSVPTTAPTDFSNIRFGTMLTASAGTSTHPVTGSRAPAASADEPMADAAVHTADLAGTGQADKDGGSQGSAGSEEHGAAEDAEAVLSIGAHSVGGRWGGKVGQGAADTQERESRDMLFDFE